MISINNVRNECNHIGKGKKHIHIPTKWMKYWNEKINTQFKFNEVKFNY